MSSSQFYPPRAGRFGRLRRAGFGIRSQLYRLRRFLHSVSFLSGILIPGLGFYLAGQRRAAKILWTIDALGFLVFFVWLGQALSTLAAVAILAVHSVSIASVTQRLPPGCRLGWKALLNAVLFAAVVLGLYRPAMMFMERHLVLPLQTDNGVVIINVFSGTGNLARGDIVAYSIVQAGVGRNMLVLGGYGVDPLLAGPGDRVVFGQTAFQVNDRVHARHERMPVSGELVVPENHWFLWPVSTRLPPVAGAEEHLLRIGTIHEKQMIGRPFKRWFWRRQLTYEPVFQP